MSIINRFSQEEMDLYLKLADESYVELKKLTRKIFRLRKIPKLYLDFNVNTTKGRQPLSYETFDMDVEGEEIKDTYVDRIVLGIPALWAYLALFDLDKKLSPENFQSVLKEFFGIRIIYHFIQAHDIQTNYKGFCGKRADIEPEELFKPIATREKTGYYYSKVASIYDTHMPNNFIGRLLAYFTIDIIEYLTKNNSTKGIQKDPIIKNRISELVVWLRHNSISTEVH